jgi:hypothetical protein
LIAAISPVLFKLVAPRLQGCRNGREARLIENAGKKGKGVSAFTPYEAPGLEAEGLATLRRRWVARGELAAIGPGADVWVGGNRALQRRSIPPPTIPPQNRRHNATTAPASRLALRALGVA